MLTNKITGFSADLLNTVRGILGEAKKCPADCECEKCEAEDDEKEMKEGSMPTADEPSAADKKTADKVRAMLAKEKKPVKEEAKEDLPFEGPYRKTGDRKDEYGNKVKNVAKHLAKKAMKANEEADYLEKDLKKRKDNNDKAIKDMKKMGSPMRNPHFGEEVEQVDEISSDMAHRYLKGKRERDYDISADGKSSSLKKPQSFSKMNKDMKSTARALRTIEKAKKANEEAEHNNCGTPECCGQCDTPGQIDETAKVVAHLQKRYGDNIRKSHVRSAASDFGVDASKLAKAVRTKLGKTSLAEDEQIDEVSKATLGRYINKAKDSIDTASYRQGHKEAHGSSSKPLEKKLTKRHKGISTAVSKLTKEDAEQIDELSKGTMGRYINKAATKMGSQGVTAGLKIAADEKSSKNFKDMGKREKGIKLAVNKLTKEEQDFVDALNADIEQIDELSKDAMLKYLSANKKSGARGGRDTIKRMRGADMAVRKYTARDNKYVRVPATEEVELDEARGRPRKAGAKDFTIHPKTKEKLMHNNPEHMKKIEVLQKNGILEKPKVEAGQHIMNQLRKAKTSMLGGSKINFTHGDSKEVSGTHAAKILTKYAGMKPDEKENFQKFVGHSHENLMKHV